MKRTYPVKSVKLWGAKGLDQEGLTIYVLLWGTKWVEIIRKAFVHSIHHSANLQVNCTRIGYYLPAQNVKKDFFELTELLYFPLRKKIYQNLWVGSTSSCWKLELCDKKHLKVEGYFKTMKIFFLTILNYLSDTWYCLKVWRKSRGRIFVCPTAIIHLENLYHLCRLEVMKWHNFQVWWQLQRVVYAKVWQKIMYTWTVFVSIFSTVKARDIAQTVL